MFHPVTLTTAEVYEIRLFHDEGWTKIWHNLSAVALAYGVSRCVVSSIGSRHHYKTLPEKWQSSRRKWR